MKLAAAALALFLSACAAVTPVDVKPGIAMEEFRVASDPGIDLYVRNKHPAGQAKFSGDRIVVMVHGATFAAENTFDLALNGKSWMDHLAAAGYDVYTMSVRGYGKSSHGGILDRPAKDNPPFASTEQAVTDLAAVVDFIRKRRGVDRINLLGWSWGTRITQWYTSLHSDKVEKLVLYAPAYIRRGASLIAESTNENLPAYRVVGPDAARRRWLTGVPAHVEVIPKGWFEAWSATNFPGGTLKAPNGVLKDGQKYWNNGSVPWKAENIRVPVLLIHGEWDQDTPTYMSQDIFAALKAAPYKQHIIISEATHSMMFEKNRGALFRNVQAFLDQRHDPEK